MQDYVPKFLNRVSEAINRIVHGGHAYWITEAGIKTKLKPLLSSPAHEKFLGDGSMLIWVETKQSPFTPKFLIELCNRCWNLSINFDAIAAAAYDEMPVVDLPESIRFGLARGTVYELSRKGVRQHEYIGFCLNLASRLQRYCPDLSFIASARVALPQATLEKNRWIRVVAKEIKGFPREIVLVDTDQYKALKPAIRSQLFDPVDPK